MWRNMSPSLFVLGPIPPVLRPRPRPRKPLTSSQRARSPAKTLFVFFSPNTRNEGGTALVPTRLLCPLAHILHMELKIAAPHGLSAMWAGARLLVLFSGLRHAQPGCVGSAYFLQMPAKGEHGMENGVLPPTYQILRNQSHPIGELTVAPILHLVSVPRITNYRQLPPEPPTPSCMS